MLNNLTLDIGGTSIKYGFFDPDAFTVENPIAKRFEPEPVRGSDFPAVEAAVSTAIEKASKTGQVHQIGISTTGSVWPNGVVKSAGHFSGYENIDWSKILKAKFPQIQNVAVENDGKASAWAEFSHFGSSTDSHVHFVLGTGVGSSTVVNGELMHGDSGEAGFLGHTVVTRGETIVCSCDRQGCVETIASGPGLVHELGKKSGETIRDFDQFKERLAAQDQYALEALDFACHSLGNISATLVNSLNPKNITFGGGVLLGICEATSSFGKPNYFLEKVQEEIARVAFSRSAQSTNLHYGVFNNDGGLVGAALLAAN